MSTSVSSRSKISARLSRKSSTDRSSFPFSSPVPTVTRTIPRIPGRADWSRTSTPSSRRNAQRGAASSPHITRKKLPPAARVTKPLSSREAMSEGLRARSFRASSSTFALPFRSAAAARIAATFTL